MGDLSHALGNGVQAREFYEKALEISERLADSAPENVDYARDLWVSCWRMADAEIDAGDDVKSLEWWRKAHDILQAMCERGWLVSDEDRGFLTQLKQKLDRQ